jgi:hypothetical protein
MAAGMEEAEVLWASSEEGMAAVKAAWDRIRGRGYLELADVGAACWAAHLAALTARPPEPSVHDHVFTVAGVQAGPPFTPLAGPERPVTIVLLRCAVCALPSTATLDGVWTLAQLLARPGCM